MRLSKINKDPRITELMKKAEMLQHQEISEKTDSQMSQRANPALQGPRSSIQVINDLEAISEMK